MAVYVVTWDLNREKPNYSAARTAFVNQLETYQNVKDPGLDSVRFISTTSGANDIDAYLLSAIARLAKSFAIFKSA